MELLIKMYNAKNKEEVIEYIKKVYVPRGEKGMEDLKRDLHTAKILAFIIRFISLVVLSAGVALLFKKFGWTC